MQDGVIIPAAADPNVSVFLFCNDNYGAAYAETAAKLAHERGFDIRIVLSGKRRHGEAFEALDRGARRHAAAMRLGLHVHVSMDVNSRRFQGRVQPGDHAVIAGFDQIFREPAIGRFASFVNFHPSLLPFYRGPLPSYWCLRNRETHTGYTLHRVTPVVDAGEVLHQEIVPVGDASHPRELDRRIAARGAECFARWIEHLVTGAAWQPSTLPDTRGVYRRPLEYAPYPDRVPSSRSFAAHAAQESISR